MKNNINHYRIFLHGLRTAFIFLAGFLSYEFLNYLETTWNKTHPNNEQIHFMKKKLYKFIFILFFDMIIIYLFILMFDIHL